MPGAGYNIPISLSAASSLTPSQQIQAGTAINFGAGYISAPGSFTANPTSIPSAVSTAAEGNAAAQQATDATVSPAGSSLGGLSKVQGELLIVGVVAAVLLGVGALLYEKGILK